MDDALGYDVSSNPFIIQLKLCVWKMSAILTAMYCHPLLTRTKSASSSIM